MFCLGCIQALAGRPPSVDQLIRMDKTPKSFLVKSTAIASTVVFLLTGCSNNENNGEQTTGGFLPNSPSKNPNLFVKGDYEKDSHYVRELDPYAKPVQPGNWVTTADGLRYQDLEEGWGMSPSQGKMVMVHYSGFLSNGTRFERSLDKGMPFTFMKGSGKVIKGFDEAVEGMKVGGKRKVIIPPNLAYGAAGHGKKIPADETLTYEIQLLSCDR